MSTTDIRDDDAVVMRDGVSLRTVVRGADSARPRAALLSRTPYDIELGLAHGEPDPYVAAGYVVVLQDCRGTSGSDGVWRPLESEIDDGADTVGWIRGQPWCDGRVAMFGASYGSSVQFLALRGGAQLDAMSPSTSTADFFQARFAGGAALRLSFNVIWAAQVAAQGMRRSGLREPALDELVPLMDFCAVARAGGWAEVAARVTDLVRPLLAHRPLREIAAFRSTAPWFYEWMFDEDPTRRFWLDVSPKSMYDRVDVPALHVAGWFDSNLEGTITNYQGLQRTGRAPQRLVVGPWRHWLPNEQRIGEIDFGAAAIRSMSELNIAWFDAQLGAGPSSGPPVEIFVMGRNSWRAEAEWPPARAVQTDFYLADAVAGSAGSTGRLCRAPGVRGGHRFQYDPRDPVPTRGGRLSLLGELPGPWDQRAIEQRADVLTYTSAPLEAEIEVTGLVAAEIWMSSSAPDTDVTAKLVDVHPDGRALNVCDGIVRARAIHPMPLRPGHAYPYRVTLGHTSQVFGAGHRIRLQVSSSCYPQFEPNPNTGQRTGTFADADLRVAHQHVRFGTGHPSRLTLPVIPA